MNRSISRSPRRRAGARLLIGSLVVASLAGAYAVRSAFDRPGEDALRLLPSSAFLVGTLDLVPAPNQVLTFKNIEDGLTRNGMGDFTTKSVVDIFDQSSFAEAVRPYIQRSVAFAAVAGEDGSSKNVILVVLKDVDKVAEALKRYGKPAFYKGTSYFTLSQGKVAAAVIDGRLAISQDAVLLHEVRLVAEGRTEPVTAKADLMAAREQVAPDANLKVFFVPYGARTTTQKDVGHSWAAMGATIRENGLDVTGAGLADPAVTKGEGINFDLKPMRESLLSSLPSGAYAVTATGDPWSMVNGKVKEKGDEIKKPLNETLGLDPDTDLAAAFGGNTVLAAYPTGAGKTEGLSLLALIDDSNGANPDAVVRKLQEHFQSEAQKDPSSPPLFVRKDRNGVETYRLGDEMEGDLHKESDKALGHTAIGKPIVDEMTFTWALVNHTVIAATSEALLDRAVKTYRDRNDDLAHDPAFAPVTPIVFDGSQNIAIFNIARIVEGIRATMDPKDREANGRYLDAFAGIDTPLYLKGRFQSGGRFDGRTFIPLDYGKVLDLLKQ